MIIFGMLTYLKESKDLMLGFLGKFLGSRDEDFGTVNRWGPDVLTRLREFTSRGKMIRGGLVRFTHDMYSGKCREDAVAAGAAMELFQSAFLVHDDIMDRDDTRRGAPALHAQYSASSAREGLVDAARIGEALGICAGDISIFLAFDILSRLETGEPAKSRLLARFCRELEYVGLAQMADVHHGASGESLSRGEILDLYRYKTGRYTFSLPFAAGLILAGRGEPLVERFIHLGEKMGILFQIKDDELGIWADEAELGKPVGSDISENKKTIYREILFQRAEPEARGKLAGLYGGKDLSPGDVSFVRGELERLGVKREIAELSDKLAGEARELIHSLPDDTAPIWKSRLSELLDYNLKRGK